MKDTKRGIIGRVQASMPTPEDPFFISASKLRDWLRCRLKFHWRYNLSLEPVRRPIALSFGALGHNCMEDWYKAPAPKRTKARMKAVVKKRFAETNPEELSADDLDLLEAMLLGYVDWATPIDTLSGMTKVIPEKMFQLPLDDAKTIIVRGRIDTIFTAGKLVGGHEHKFKGQIRIDQVDLNIQLSVYLWALRQLYPGYDRYQMNYNVLRKQMPTPRVKAPLFHRELVERTDDDIEVWRQDAINTVQDMIDGGIYANPMDSCGWDCDFTKLCLLRGDKKTFASLMKSEYQKKTYRS